MERMAIAKLSRRFGWGKPEVQVIPVRTSERSAYKAMRMCCSIYETLMEAWARTTKHYLADIIYDFYAILDVAREIDESKGGLKQDKETVIYIFGLRECGVDNPRFVESRTAGGSMADYKRIYMVTLTATADGYTQRLYKATKILGKRRAQNESDVQDE